MISAIMRHRRVYGPMSFYVSLTSLLPTSPNSNGVRMGTLKSQLIEYDREHEFLRQCTVPEEDRAQYTSAKWSGEYRWFRADNVVCLEKVRRLLNRTGAGS
jgi:hypothetical protein